jgi:hypothetical protein
MSVSIQTYIEFAFHDIEHRLRVDAAPLVNLVNTHGGAAERAAWKAVYSGAIRAQVLLPSETKDEP